MVPTLSGTSLPGGRGRVRVKSVWDKSKRFEMGLGRWTKSGEGPPRTREGSDVGSAVGPGVGRLPNRPRPPSRGFHRVCASTTTHHDQNPDSWVNGVHLEGCPTNSQKCFTTDWRGPHSLDSLSLSLSLSTHLRSVGKLLDRVFSVSWWRYCGIRKAIHVHWFRSSGVFPLFPLIGGENFRLPGSLNVRIKI